MSTLRVNNMTNVGGTGPTYAPGHIIQVVSATKTNTFTSTSGTFTDIPDMSVSITPKSTSSKMLITVTFVAGISNASYNCYFNIVRNGVAIGQTTGGTSNQTISPYTNDAANLDSISLSYLDAPITTSAITYKLQGRIDAGQTFHVGRYAAGASAPSISTITVQEVAA